MHEKEILYFTEAFQLAQEECYVDAINKFQNIIDDFPDSDLADDAMYNTGLCYYEMSQFQKAIEILEELIKTYPNATITALENGNEFGRTAAKAYYLIVQCYIGLGDIQKSKTYIPILDEYTNTYVIRNSEKYSFAQLAKDAIDIYTAFTKGED